MRLIKQRNIWYQKPTPRLLKSAISPLRDISGKELYVEAKNNDCEAGATVNVDVYWDYNTL